MSTFLQDVRYTLRLFSKQPGFTIVAVLTLAIGIGANTALFSIVNAVILRPLPYPDAERLTVLWANTNSEPTRAGAASIDDFLDWRRDQRSFSAMAALHHTSGTLMAAGDRAERLRGAAVSANLFDLLGVRPALGRTFGAEDEQFGAPPVLILSHGLWLRRFAADRGIVGRTVRLDSEPHTVLGVMPEGFDFPAGLMGTAPDYWRPTRFDTSEPQRGSHFLSVIGRLEQGVTLEAAQAEMSSIAARLEQEYPQTNTDWRIWLYPLHEEFAGDARTPLLILLGAVACVLLIACANVANLLLARATGRSRELAVRVALGAGRTQLLRQLITESLVLSAAGALLGLMLAAWSLDLVPALAGEWLPRADAIDIDRRVLGFTMAAAVLTALLFGFAPALYASRAAVAEALRGSGRSTGGARGTHRTRALLVIAEVAAAFVLLIGAGLMLRSFQQLEAIHPGFEPDRILSASLSLPAAKYQEPPQQSAVVSQYLERLRSLTGVQTAAATTLLPMARQESISVFSIEGRPDQGPGKWPIARTAAVSDGFFEAMGIALERGRFFDAADVQGSERVGVVSASLVRKYFPDEDPIGRRVKLDTPDGDSPWLTIVGIVDDVRHRNLSRDVYPTLYEVLAQSPAANVSLVIRSSGVPIELVAAARGQLAALDRELALDRVQTMEAVIAASLSSERFRTRLMGLFAGIALLLAAIGIYGVLAYSVEQRSQEMGLRIALGAQPRHLRQLVTAQGLRMVLAGIVAGAVAAAALTRVVASLLYGVSPTDPLTFMAIAVLLLVVAGLAANPPARRATAADPMVVLRAE